MGQGNSVIDENRLLDDLHETSARQVAFQAHRAELRLNGALNELETIVLLSGMSRADGLSYMEGRDVVLQAAHHHQCYCPVQYFGISIFDRAFYERHIPIA